MQSHSLGIWNLQSLFLKRQVSKQSNLAAFLYGYNLHFSRYCLSSKNLICTLKSKRFCHKVVSIPKLSASCEVLLTLWTTGHCASPNPAIPNAFRGTLVLWLLTLMLKNKSWWFASDWYPQIPQLPSEIWSFLCKPEAWHGQWNSTRTGMCL